MKIAEQARTWIGTPFHHQGRLKKKGCDCLGMVIGVAHELKLTHEGKALSHLDNIHYSRTPNVAELLEKLKDNLTEVFAEHIQEGDILLMDIIDNPQHLAVVANYKYGGWSIIHAVAGKGVVEQRMTENWIKRINTAYRFEG